MNKESKEVLLIEHQSHAGPDRFKAIMDELEIPHYDHLGEDPNIPDPRDFDAVLLMGGASSANDQTESMRAELDAVRKAFWGKIAFLGECLGHQILAKAKGGSVVTRYPRQIGFKDAAGKLFEMKLTEEGRKDPLFAGIDTPIRLLHLNGEVVAPNSKTTVLAENFLLPTQAIRVAGNMYGIQGHIEVTDDLFEQWLLEDGSLQRMDQDQLRQDYEDALPLYSDSARKIFENFLGIAGLLK